jgi:ribosomal protein S18 acetylase RimI-like enzyme
MNMNEYRDHFPLSLQAVIRPCREDDLPALEWFGLFGEHRVLIRHVFEKQRRGEAVMLVLEANGETSGQLWIEFEQRDEQQVGVIWAIRVMPCLQRLGIGERLVRAAETLLLERGFTHAQLTVEADNLPARRLYERLGYRLTGTRLAGQLPGSTDADGRTQAVLAKELRRTALAESAQ